MVLQKFMYTPEDTCITLLKDIEFKNNDRVLEPCKGSGNFYNNLPSNIIKEYCEIEENKDFFKYDKVITNPPYRNIENTKNICMDFIFKCIDVCNGEVWLLLNLQMLNTLTPRRLNIIKDKGFNLCFMKILNIKKWYGRYYWICFSNKKNATIDFIL